MVREDIRVKRELSKPSHGKPAQPKTKETITMTNTTKESSLKQQFLNNLAQHVTEDELISLFPNKEDYTSFLQRAFSQLLNKIMLRERDYYLANNPDSVGNGFCPPRTFRAGILPLDAYIPRTRDSFYPQALPKYKRNLPETYEELFYSLLLEAKSFSSIRNTIHNLGLSYSQEELDKLVDELHREAKEFNSRPLASDWLFIFIDAKAIDLRDEAGVIKKGTHFIVTGVGLDGKKEILTTKANFMLRARGYEPL
jgi:transposase-like protein